jgi:CBS domain-containing protein
MTGTNHLLEGQGVAENRRMKPPTAPACSAGEAMHRGVINTTPQAPMTEIAATMARERVHCVVVEGLARDSDQQERLVWGIVSDLDLIKALHAGENDLTAGQIAATEIVTVGDCDGLEQVAQLMAEHECNHLVVVAEESGEPVGVISSLDVAAAAT